MINILEYVYLILGFENKAKLKSSFNKSKQQKRVFKTKRTRLKKNAESKVAKKSNVAGFVLSRPASDAKIINNYFSLKTIAPNSLDQLAQDLSGLTKYEEIDIDLANITRQEIAIEMIQSSAKNLKLTVQRSSNIVSLRKSQ